MEESNYKSKTLQNILEQLLGIAAELDEIISLDAPNHLTTLETKELEAALKHIYRATMFIVPTVEEKIKNESANT